jgi:hypothetical protein
MLFSILSKTLIFFAIDEKCFEALIPSLLGQGCLGLTKDIFLKPKQPIDLTDMPMLAVS